MSQHYTLSTTETQAWCNKCNGETPHRVSHRKLQFCIPCWNRSEAESIERKRREAEQGNLFKPVPSKGIE